MYHQNDFQCNIDPCYQSFAHQDSIKKWLTFLRYMTTKVWPSACILSFDLITNDPSTVFCPAAFWTYMIILSGRDWTLTWFSPSSDIKNWCRSCAACSGTRASQNRVVVLFRSPPWVYESAAMSKRERGAYDVTGHPHKLRFLLIPLTIQLTLSHHPLWTPCRSSACAQERYKDVLDGISLMWGRIEGRIRDRHHSLRPHSLCQSLGDLFAA
jgi:hypothetical protein